jgi:NitT/TauT family transport system ATP-binding protein
VGVVGDIPPRLGDAMSGSLMSDTSPNGSGKPSERPSGYEAGSVARVEPVIRIDAVEKIFWTWEKSHFFSSDVVGQYRALAPVSMSVQEGELVAILGPSGCGKSTLLSIVAGLLEPTCGSVNVCGRPVTGPGVEGMAMVFQHVGLFPWLTAEENVTFGLDVGRNKSAKAGALEQARVVLRTVGLEEFGTCYPSQLSGGMQQRVAIARALVTEPKILLMDEPFGALDALTRLTLQEELLRLRSEWGGTIMFVTHDIDEAVYLADRIVVMATGPGRIASQVDVDLPSPRDSVETRADAQFIKLVSGIWSDLRPQMSVTEHLGPEVTK